MAMQLLFAFGGEAGSWDFYERQGWSRSETQFAPVGLTTVVRHRTSQGFGGDYALQVTEPSSAMTPVFSSDARWFHCWIQQTALSTTVSDISFYRLAALQFRLRFVALTGSVLAQRGATVVATADNAYNPAMGHWLSVHLNADNAGSVRVYLDGHEVLAFNGDTQNGATPGWDQVRFLPDAATGQNITYYDDILVTDDDGGLVTEPLHECYGQPLVPQSVVSGNLTGNPETGADRYLNVADVPWNPATCNIASAVGDEDLYAFGGFHDLGGDVLIVSVYANALTEGTLTQAELSVSSGGVTTYGTPVPLPSSPDSLTFARYFAEDPAGGPWTAGAINALQAGVRFS